MLGLALRQAAASRKDPRLGRAPLRVAARARGFCGGLASEEEDRVFRAVLRAHAQEGAAFPRAWHHRYHHVLLHAGVQQQVLRSLIATGG